MENSTHHCYHDSVDYMRSLNHGSGTWNSVDNLKLGLLKDAGSNPYQKTPIHWILLSQTILLWAKTSVNLRSLVH